MRQRQPGLSPHRIAVEDQIEIQRARGVSVRALTPRIAFDGLERAQ